MARPQPVVVPGGLSTKKTFQDIKVDVGAIAALIDAIRGSRRQTSEKEQFQEAFPAVFAQEVPAAGPPLPAGGLPPEGQPITTTEAGEGPTALAAPENIQALTRLLSGTPQGRALGEQLAAQQALSKPKKTPFAAINVEKFTPESVAAFETTGRQSDLRVREEKKGGLKPTEKVQTFETVTQRKDRGTKDYQEAYRNFYGISTKGADIDIKEAKRMEDTILKSDIVIRKVDKALEQANLFTTGFAGWLTGRIPGSPAFNLEKTIDTVKAITGFEELKRMKEASPTGGALGQVTVREIEFLQSVIASLDKEQSEPQLRENLGQVKELYQNLQASVKLGQMIAENSAIEASVNTAKKEGYTSFEIFNFLTGGQ